MSERRSKFFGLITFLILVIGFSYLMLTGSKANQNEFYNQIIINENTLLPESEYLRYTGLSDSTMYDNLTLLDVKTEIEKHPYLRKAEVEFDGISTILVEVEEKEIKAVLLQKNELKLLTSDFETLLLFPPSSIEELPVISKLGFKGNDSFDEIDMEFAFRIIDAITLSDTNVRRSLAEINIRKGGDAILTFTDLQFPVLFGKSDVVQKSLMLKNLWHDLTEEQNTNEETSYLDLRYKNKIFIGKSKTELASR